MKMKKSLGESVFDGLNILVLALLAVSCLYPLLHVLFASVSDPDLLIRHSGPLYWPLGFTLAGYKIILHHPSVASGYFNTILYTGAGTALAVLMTSLGAYVLSRRHLLLKKLFMMMVTLTMFFGGGLIPYYLIIRDLGLLDTRLVMIIPGAISSWNLIVLRTSFMGLPAGLEDSARIDGANDFIVLFRIVMPISKPVLAVIALFYAVGNWNSWFNAAIFLTSRDLFPLQLFLREILIQKNSAAMVTSSLGSVSELDMNRYKSILQYAIIIVATVPILVIYPFLQKYFVKGVIVGSLKE